MTGATKDGFFTWPLGWQFVFCALLATACTFGFFDLVLWAKGRMPTGLCLQGLGLLFLLALGYFIGGLPLREMFGDGDKER